MLEKSGRTFVVRPREDMTFAADGVIIPLNLDLPVLTDEIVDDVVRRVLVWAGVSVPKPKRYFR